MLVNTVYFHNATAGMKDVRTIYAALFAITESSTATTIWATARNARLVMYAKGTWQDSTGELVFLRRAEIRKVGSWRTYMTVKFEGKWEQLKPVKETATSQSSVEFHLESAE